MTSDSKWKLVPVEPDWAMQIAGRDAILSEDDTIDLSTDNARAAYRAMLAASPAAPGAEVEPVAWQWRFRAPNSDSPAAAQWSSWADGRAPELRASVYETEERPLYTHPLDAATIRAEAEDFGALSVRIVETVLLNLGIGFDASREPGADRRRDRLCRLIDPLLPLADKGEAEGWRPTHQHVKRGSTYRVIGEAEAFEWRGKFGAMRAERDALREQSDRTDEIALALLKQINPHDLPEGTAQLYFSLRDQIMVHGPAARAALRPANGGRDA